MLIVDLLVNNRNSAPVGLLVVAMGEVPLFALRNVAVRIPGQF